MKDLQMLRVKQIKGTAKEPRRFVETIKGLGLRKIGDEVELNATPQVLGMLKSVAHLVSWQEQK